MPEFQLNIEIQKESLMSSISEKINGIEPMLTDTIGAILEVFEDRAKAYAPYKSGALSDSITTEFKGFEGTVYSPLEYFVYVIEGTKPHTIEAVNAKALWWEGALHPVKKVHHPGTKPNDFMAMAFMDGMFDAEDLIDKLGEWLVD